MRFKKPKFWDLKKPNYISLLLLPFTMPIILNNFLLKFKSIKKNSKIKTICVGNIYLGGTGKTPTTIALFKIIQKLNLKVLTAKKFYKSQMDENIILDKKTKFITKKNRNMVLDEAVKSNHDVLIFDDGLQDRTLKYNLNLVCFDAENFIGNGCLIPSGPLREKLDSLKKYDCVFFKSYDEITKDKLQLLKRYNSEIRIFETFYQISNLEKFDLTEKYLIFSGIGNSKSFHDVLIKNKFNIVNEIVFADHHNYQKQDVDKIITQAKSLGAKILTTEKDYVKVEKLISEDIKFIEIDLIIKKEKKFIDFLKTKIYD